MYTYLLRFDSNMRFTDRSLLPGELLVPRAAVRDLMLALRNLVLEIPLPVLIDCSVASQLPHRTALMMYRVPVGAEKHRALRRPCVEFCGSRWPYRERVTLFMTFPTMNRAPPWAERRAVAV